jgi:hypothetical protein
MRSRIVCSAVAVAIAAAAPARAEPSATERAMAESLFREAKKLLERGKTPEACAKLAESYRIDPAGGTLLNLAKCHEIEGKTATAWTEFNEARAAARKARRPDREKAAQEHMNELEPRMSRVTVTVPTQSMADGMVVRLDGSALAEGVLSTPIAVDPGEHVVSATAPGRKPFELKLSFKEGERKAVLVPALALEAAPPPPPPPPPAWKRPAGIAALSAGAVLLGVGVGFGVRAISLGATAVDACPDHRCSPAGWKAVNDGRTAANVANGTLVAGGALAAAGTVLLVLAAVAPSQPKSGWIAPAVGPGTAQIAAGGAF